MTDCASLVGGVNYKLLNPTDISNQPSRKPSIPTLGNRRVFASLLEQGSFEKMEIRFVESTLLEALLQVKSGSRTAMHQC